MEWSRSWLVYALWPRRPVRAATCKEGARGFFWFRNVLLFLSALPAPSLAAACCGCALLFTVRPFLTVRPVCVRQFVHA
jgi:hypothetical protein